MEKYSLHQRNPNLEEEASLVEPTLRLSAAAPQALKKMVCEENIDMCICYSPIGGAYFKASLADWVGGKLLSSIGKETKLTLCRI